MNIYKLKVLLSIFSPEDSLVSLFKTYMPYLTLWDKISQNLAHLEANSHKIFKTHRIFRPSYNIFYEEINIQHFVVFITNFIHYNKGFGLFWGSFQVIFITRGPVVL